MFQDSDFKSKPLPTDIYKAPVSETSTSEKTSSHLKLVVSNPAPIQETPISFPLTQSNVRFMVKNRKIGQQVYEISTQDLFHDMECNLILDIERNADETTVVCHFPVFLNKPNKFLDEDETLYGIIVVQFQMNVLEQLFLFCTDQGASQLTIYMDDTQAEGFGIYQNFLVYCDETLTGNGEKTEIIIPTHRQSFDKWVTYMAEMNLKLEQDLWREQRTNPSIRHYLKSRPLA